MVDNFIQEWIAGCRYFGIIQYPCLGLSFPLSPTYTYIPTRLRHYQYYHFILQVLGHSWHRNKYPCLESLHMSACLLVNVHGLKYAKRRGLRTNDFPLRYRKCLWGRLEPVCLGQLRQDADI